MDIERLQVEGGFLDGLDLKFSKGLNVLIGARGTGKTSVIELIRYALAARNHTPEAAERSTEHAEAVLNDGCVTVEMADEIETVLVSRTSGEDEPQANGQFIKPLVFSQTEIENLGLSESGRLRLLDGFISGGATLTDDEAKVIAEIRSNFKEIASVENDREKLTKGLDEINSIKTQINLLEKEELKHQASSIELTEKQKTLSKINDDISTSAVRAEVLERFLLMAEDWSTSLESLVDDDFGPEEWDELEGVDPLNKLRAPYENLVSEAESLIKKFDSLAQKAKSEHSEIIKEKILKEANARKLRADVEQFVTGAGTVSRQLSLLRTELAQLSSRKKVVKERDQRLSVLRARRDERIKQLDKIRANRFERRQAAAKALTEALSPQIRVTVERYAQYSEYSEALTEALRGSGMRYTDLVSALTASVSPFELITFVDTNDFLSLADIAAIPKDRAARLLGHLREVGAADIVVSSIEDNVRMSLLDGLDYKDVENLSAGQRCTVILSIVLQHKSRTLIIDQPEDHLDNAYIATTVIKAIKNRHEHGQLIISTHNANIPVLGSADLVIEMTSDGRNGFIQVCKELSDPQAVDAITNVMEGGRKAFTDRALFYKEHEL